MSAIFGFTFHMGRMTEVLTPDIYIELTAVGAKMANLIVVLVVIAKVL